MDGRMTRNRPVDQEEDQAWILASQNGDTSAFSHLVLKWEKTVFNIAFRMLQNPEEAEEAAQEIFLLAFRSIRRFRNASKFSTWIYRIALNHCLTCVRNRPPGVYHSIDDRNFAPHRIAELQISGTPDRAMLHSERAAKVSAALLLLQPEQQAVIELKFFQEMTFEEIAEVLETPLSTIKSRLYTGLEMLKTRLGNGFIAGRRD